MLPNFRDSLSISLCVYADMKPTSINGHLKEGTRKNMYNNFKKKNNASLYFVFLLNDLVGASAMFNGSLN